MSFNKDLNIIFETYTRFVYGLNKTERVKLPIPIPQYERLISQNNAIHQCMGMMTESAEILDILKKHIYYDKPFDKEHIKEEMGDLLWYFTNMMSEVGVSLEEVIFANMEKLSKRYPNGFTNEDAQKRVDVNMKLEV